MSTDNTDSGDSAALEGPSSSVDQPLGAISQVREVKATSSTTGYTSSLTDMGSIPSVFERWVKVDEILFDETTAFGTIYFTDPLRGWFSNSLVADKRKNFQYFRGGIEVYFVATIPPMTYGAAVITAIPVGGRTQSSSDRNWDPRVLITEQCLAYDDAEILDYAACNDITMKLPFLWNQDYIDMSSYVSDTLHSMYHIAYTTLAPIKSTTSDLTVTGRVTMYVRPIGAEIAVPTYQANKSRVTKRSDDLKNAGTSFSSATSGIPILSNIGRAVGSGMDAVSGAMAALGFTRESQIEPPQQVVFRPFSNAMSHDVHDTSIIAAVSSSNSTDRSPDFVCGDEHDAASMKSLLSRWTLIDVVSWDVTQTPGTVLVNIPIAPLVTNRGTLNPYRANYTVGGTVGLPFEYWRGGMTYYLVIPMSVRHRGKLQISRNNVSLPGGEEITNVTFNQIIDAEATMCYKINVGYAKSEPMLSNVPMPRYTVQVSYESGARPPNINGYLSLQVVNSLEGPEASLDTQIFIFAACDPDLEFAVPRTNIPMTNDAGTIWSQPNFNDRIRFQAGAMGDSGCVDMEYDLVPKNAYNVSGTCSGERIESVRALMQIPSQNAFAYTSPATTPYNTLFLPHFQLGMFNGQTTGYIPENFSGISFNWTGFYKCFFHAISGSARYKLAGSADLLSDSGAILSSTYDVFVSHQTKYLGFHPTIDWPSTVSPMFRVSTGFDGAEVVVPWYNNLRYELPSIKRSTGGARPNRFDDQRYDSIHIFFKQKDFSLPAGSTYSCALTVFQSAGPDLRLGRFARCPTIWLQDEPIILSPSPYGNV